MNKKNSPKINFKRKKFRRISKGIIYIKSSFNNTILTLTNLKGDVLAWSSAGSCGFKGSRKSTPFVTKRAVDNLVKKLIDKGLQQIQVIIRGIGPGRETALRCLQKTNLQMILIRDMTAIPHNGCRPPKKRRI